MNAANEPEKYPVFSWVYEWLYKKTLVRYTIINTIASSVQAKAPGTVLPDK